MTGYLIASIVVLAFNILWALVYPDVYWESYNYKIAKREKELTLFFIVYGYWLMGIGALVAYFLTK